MTQTSAAALVTATTFTTAYQGFIKTLLYLAYVHKIITDWVSISQEYIDIT